MRLVSRSPDLLQVTSSGPPYISPGAQGAGMVRYNTSNNEMEVWDGAAWRTLSMSAELELSPEIRQTVEWARRRQAEERELEDLCKKHPGLKDLRDKFEMMRILIQQESHK